MTNRFGQSFQRFLHNFAAYGFGQVINITSQIFALPLFLHYWTKQEYGEWLVLTSIPSLLWTLDNGLSGLAGSKMAVLTGGGDWEEANEIFRAVLWVQGMLSIAVFSVTALIVSTTNVSSIFGFAHMSRSDSGKVLLLMIGYMLLGFGVGLLKSAYRASTQEARAVTVSNFWRMTDFFATVGVLCFGGHAVVLACCLVCSISFWNIFMFLDIRSRCPRVDFSLKPARGAHLRKTLYDGVPILANEAAGAFFLQGYPLVVNHLLGVEMVVILTTIRTASRTLLQAVQMVSMASSSELSRTYGIKDWESYLRLLKVLLAVTIWAAAGACLGLTLFGPWAIGKWTSGKIAVDHLTMFLFALSVACQSAWGACGYILVSTNMHHFFNYFNLFMTLVGLSVVFLAVHAFGFLGVPLTMVTVDLILLAWALQVCRTKLSFVSLGSLGVVFQPSFYMSKAEILFRR
jgi:O-antigen/teichoic acid export membrane protein